MKRAVISVYYDSEHVEDIYCLNGGQVEVALNKYDAALFNVELVLQLETRVDTVRNSKEVLVDFVGRWLHDIDLGA